MVRVLQLITVPLTTNGLALYPIRMVERMDSRVQVDFLACYAEPELEARIKKLGARLYLAPSRLRNPIAYMCFVARTVRENGYSVVHAHGNSCTLALDLIAARRGGAKVRIAHSHNTYCRFRMLHLLLRPAFNRAYTHALACGDEAGKWLFRNRPFEILPNAIDARAFAPNEETRARVRRELNAEGRQILLHVGNFSEAKNPLFFIDLMQRLNPSCALWMVGDGPLRADTERRAREKGLPIAFTGVRSDIPALMQGADAFLLPSLYEGLPTVALEAQAAGLPTLLSESIARRTAFSKSAQFLPLNADLWAARIRALPKSDRNALAKEAEAALSANGYDLTAAAQALEERYLNWNGAR